MQRPIIFDPLPDPAPMRRALLALPPPERRLVIHFTPRSGSSWLTEALAATGQLGHAEEVFNPDFVPVVGRIVQADDLASYIALVQRRMCTRGTFSVEVSAHHVLPVFGSYAAFHAHFPDAAQMWLIRRDLVAQAISLAKMVATAVGHAAANKAQVDRADLDRRFAYDGPAILHWLRHIHAAELATEAWFATSGLSPLRLAYEDMMRLLPMQIGRVAADLLDQPAPDPYCVLRRHDKLGTAQNADYADRFRADYAAELAVVDAARAQMLAGCDPFARRVDEMVARAAASADRGRAASARRSPPAAAASRP
jgi:LPS sulfotransferase NodH